MKKPAGSWRDASSRGTQPPGGIDGVDASRVDRLEEAARMASESIADDYIKALDSGKKALSAINKALSDAEVLERRIRSERLRSSSSSIQVRSLIQTLSTARERLAASIRQGMRGFESIRRHPDDMSSEVFR